MKILQNNYYQKPINQTYPKLIFTGCKNLQENESDEFVNSSKDDGLRSGSENYYNEVLQNPNMAQKVMELIAMGAAALVRLAMGQNNTQNNNNNDDLSINIYTTVTSQKNSNQNSFDETEKLKAEIEQLRSEVEVLKSSQEKNVGNENIKVEPSVVKNENETSLNNTSNVVFPKKHGRLSKVEKELKNTVEELDLSQESAEKLTKVCYELMTNKELNSSGVSTQLIEQLSLSQNDSSELDNVIDRFYEQLMTPLDKNKDLNQVEVSSEVGLTKEMPASEISDEITLIKEKSEYVSAQSPEISSIDVPKTEGPKVIGKIDLEKLPKGRPARNGNSTKTTRATEVSKQVPEETMPVPEKLKRPRITKPNKDFETATTIKVLDEDSDTFLFFIPGTADKNIVNDLQRLLLRFEEYKSVKNSSYKWMCRQAVSSCVLLEDVKKEFKLHSSTYKNINQSNLEDVKDIINSDVRFHKMFTLHSAMRLIDRFVDFDSDETLETQTHKVLDILENVIRKSFKKGTIVETYEDSDYIAPRIVIDESVYDDDARKMFGSYSLKIGICENQVMGYYNKYNKQPVISTIFSKGL